MNKGILLILDGYGEGEKNDFNAVENANTPTLHALKNNPYSLLRTDGEYVGLFPKDLGGSEVGHTTIGAGRVVKSTAKQISDDIRSGEFEKKKEIKKLAIQLKKKKADLHLVGLMSDKNIHSNINHLFELIRIFKDKAQNIFIHFITDGRDTTQFESIKFLKMLKKLIKNEKNCHILSVSGRFFALDRENHMERTNRAFNEMFLNFSGIQESEVEKYIKSEHSIGHNDQFVVPVHVENKNYSGIKKGDVVFLFNFREDRLRQIGQMINTLHCALYTMASVGGVKSKIIYPHIIVKNTLSEYLSKKHLKQVKIGESTKYAHVTYFLNGGRETPFKGEDRIHIPSLPVDDFSKTPEMRAKEIADKVVESVDKCYDAIIVNFSNPDMVGHTGDYQATVKSLEVLDKAVEKVIKKAKENGYFVLVTADHGNAEMMRTKKGEPHLAHTLNPVVCTIIGGTNEMKKHGELSDVAPTFLDLMGIKPNKSFEGKTLIKH